MYKKYFITVISALMIISIIGCSSSDTDQPDKSTDATASNTTTGTIVKPIVMLNLGDIRKEKVLHLKFYEWNGTEQLVSVPSGGTDGRTLKMKENMCVLDHANATDTQISEGDSAKVVEKAECEWVLYKGDGAMKKYNVGIYKVEITSNGNTGWTWSSSIKLEGEE